MSSEHDGLRFEARRASLDAAVREHDARAAARAAARLRIDGFPMTPEEFARATTMRRALGIALVKARMPTLARSASPTRSVTTVERGSTRARWLAAAVTLAATLLLLLLRDPASPGGGSPARVLAADPVASPLVLSRGRTVSAPVEIVVEASPSPEPSSAPVASGTPAASAAPAPTGAGTSGAGGGSGGGKGSGSGSGTESGSGSSPTPTAAPTATPVAPPAGFSRLNVLVYDGSTLRPLPDTCVVVGTTNCGPTAPHTDASGRWSADVAASSASTLWDLYFIKANYVTQHRQITLPGGVSQTYVIYLRRSG